MEPGVTGRPRRLAIDTTVAGFVLLFVIAVIVKSGALYIALQQPLGRVPVIDAEHYRMLATSLAETQKAGAELFYTAPGYPIFLSLLYIIAGSDSLLPQILQLVLGFGSLFMILMITRRLAPPPAELIAVAIALMYGPLSLFEPYFLPTTLGLFLMLSGVWIVALAADIRKVAGWVGAGAVAGLSAIVIPFMFIFPVFLGIALFFNKPRGERGLFETPLFLVAFIIGFALTVAPVSLIRYSIDHTFYPWPWGGGVVLAQGNQAGSDGTFHPLPGFTGEIRYQSATARAIAESSENRELKPHEVSDHFMRRTINEILRDPVSWLVLTGRRIMLTASSREPAQNYDIKAASRHNPFLAGLIMPFSPLFFFGLAGLFSSWSRSRTSAPLAAAILSVMSVCFMFFITTRHRLPLAPLLAAGCGCFLAGMIHDLRDGKLKKPLVSFFMLLAFSTGMIFMFPREDAEKSEAHYLYHTALALEKEGREEDAYLKYLRVIVKKPDHIAALFNLARIESARGNLDQAVKYIERTCKIEPDRADVLTNLASVLAAKGEIKRAAELAENAVSSFPESFRSHMAMAKVHKAQGKMNKALESLATAEKLGPAVLEVLFTREKWARELSDRKTALSTLKKIIDIDPVNATALNNLGRIMEDDSVDAALIYYDRAIKASPLMPEPWINKARIYAVEKKDTEKALVILEEARQKGVQLPEEK